MLPVLGAYPLQTEPVVQMVPVSLGRVRVLLVGLACPIRVRVPLAAVEPLNRMEPVLVPVIPRARALLKVLADVKVWVVFSRATLAVSRASATVPEEMLVALREVRLAPEPENVPAIDVPVMLMLPV